MQIINDNKIKIFYKYIRISDFYQNLHVFNNFLSNEKNIFMKTKYNTKTIITCLLGGIFVGFLNGLFGGGGGMVVVPLLSLLLGLEEREAHATAILTILPISLSSAIVYIINGSVNYFDLSFVSIGFVSGGIFGALILKRANNTFLRVVFSLIMIAAGLKIIL